MAARDDEGEGRAGARPARGGAPVTSLEADDTPRDGPRVDRTVVDPGIVARLEAWQRPSSPGADDAAPEPGLDPSVVAAVLGGGVTSADPSPLARVSIDALGDAFPEPPPDDGLASAAPRGAPDPAVLTVTPEPLAEVSRVESLGPAFPDDDPSRRAPAPAPGAIPPGPGPGAAAGEERGHTASVVRPNAIDEAWATIDSGDSSWARLDERTTGSRRVAPPGRAAPAPAVAARLVADRGGEHALTGDIVVGRASSSELCVPDPSVSRQHARVGREGERWAVVDLDSGNGTFVNGERVSRRALTSGDIVAFGQVRFTFVEGEDAAAPAVEHTPRVRSRPAPEPPPPPVSPGTGFHLLVALSIVLVSGAAATSIWIWRHRAPARPAVTAYFAAGATAFERRDWAGAQASFDRVLALEPMNDAARRFLERIEREKSFERQLAHARVALGRGELLLAFTEAAAISTDSAYAAAARDVTRAVDDELERRVAHARAALDAGNPRQAAEHLAVVESLRPGRPEVAALLERSRRAVANRDARDERPREAPAPASPAVEAAVRLFAAGKIDEALARIDAVGPGARELAGRMHQFDGVWADAMAEHRAKRADSALPLLEKARELEAAVTGTQPAALRGEVRKKLADMYYVRANDALMAERFPSGVDALKAALAANPGHAASRRRLDDLTTRAGELLDEANHLLAAEPERAKARYRAILQLLPATDEHARRARRHLDATP